MTSLLHTHHRPLAYIVLASLMGTACGTRDAGSWIGSIDTLESGTVVVRNSAVGSWKPGDEWSVTLETTIGTAEGDGPDLFGSITDLTIDPGGRFWVFDGQAQELRVFDGDGEFVRTIGRKGEGPGEFAQVIGFDWSPENELWIMDPNNSRIAIYDTSGTLLRNERAIGGWVMMPWPGGFDDRGRFYTYVPLPNTKTFETMLVGYDRSLQPLDTIRVPKYTGKKNYFEHSTKNSRTRAGVPFAPDLTGYFVRHTHYYWFGLTGEYKLFQQTLDGDTVRIITKDYDPVPVTSSEMKAVKKNLEWFTRQGGKLDLSLIPDVKPGFDYFFLDNLGYIWVHPITAQPDDEVFDIFDPEGEYLGRITLPFHLSFYPRPVFRDNMLYGVMRDELEVPYVIKARIDRREDP